MSDLTGFIYRGPATAITDDGMRHEVFADFTAPGPPGHFHGVMTGMDLESHRHRWLIVDLPDHHQARVFVTNATRDDEGGRRLAQVRHGGAVVGYILSV